MADATTSNQVNFLKRLWGPGYADPMYEASRFYSLCKKDTNFGGEGRYVIVDLAPTAGGSASFSEAQANMDATKSERFFVTHKKEYQLFSIQGDLIARSRGDKNAVVEAVKHQADKARYAFARSLAARAWGHAGGAKGVISASSNVATDTITLATPSNIVGFEVGMWIQTAGTDGNTGSLNDSGDKLQIVALNRALGTITLTGAWNGIASTTTGDYIFRAGDFGAAMTGAQGWAPVSDPSASESFFGVDRTDQDIQRVSGIRVSGNGAPKLETLLDALAQGHLHAARVKQFFLNPLDFRDVAKERESVRRVEGKAREGTAGFSALEVVGHQGPVMIMSETDVPQGFAWGVNMDEIYLRTAGDCPQLLNNDKVGQLLRSATDDAYEGRLGAYGNFFWENPGESLIVTF